MERTVWTDERIDDRFAHFDREMREFRAEMRTALASLDTRLTSVQTEVHAGFTSLRRDMLYAVLAMSTVLVATMATILAKTL